MNALIILIDQIVNLYIWTMLAYIIITWLVAFRIINPWQPIVRMAMDFLGRIHEPLMSRVRRFLPDLGGIDLSPSFCFWRHSSWAIWSSGFLPTGLEAKVHAAMSLAVNKTAQTRRDILPRRFRMRSPVSGLWPARAGGGMMTNAN